MIEKNTIKNHWENVYTQKTPEEVSWTQKIPTTSLRLIQDFNVSKDSSIIDIGGGDGKLVDFLLDKGFTNITVLDISEKALEKAQKRLGNKAKLIEWIATDIRTFSTNKKFDIWHDRAAFHFLTHANDVQAYVKKVEKMVEKHLVLATFSEHGPDKCSGLFIKKYSKNTIENIFGKKFDLVNALEENHITPFGTTQHFLYTGFTKK